MQSAEGFQVRQATIALFLFSHVLPDSLSVCKVIKLMDFVSEGSREYGEYGGKQSQISHDLLELRPRAERLMGLFLLLYWETKCLCTSREG